MISLRRLSRRSLQDLPDERVQVLPLANGPGGQALGLRATESDTERERDLSVRGWLALMGHRRSDHLVSRPSLLDLGREPARHDPARIARIGSVLLLTESKPQPGHSAGSPAAGRSALTAGNAEAGAADYGTRLASFPGKLKARARHLTAEFFPGSSNRVRVRGTADFLERRPGTAVARL